MQNSNQPIVSRQYTYQSHTNGMSKLRHELFTSGKSIRTQWILKCQKHAQPAQARTPAYPFASSSNKPLTFSLPVLPVHSAYLHMLSELPVRWNPTIQSRCTSDGLPNYHATYTELNTNHCQCRMFRILTLPSAKSTCNVLIIPTQDQSQDNQMPIGRAKPKAIASNYMDQ